MAWSVNTDGGTLIEPFRKVGKELRLFLGCFLLGLPDWSFYQNCTDKDSWIWHDVSLVIIVIYSAGCRNLAAITLFTCFLCLCLSGHGFH